MSCPHGKKWGMCFILECVGKNKKGKFVASGASEGETGTGLSSVATSTPAEQLEEDEKLAWRISAE
ncbi:hypothetical protein HK104_005521, partial [Borealophlyctis nickersoniae]